MIKILVVEDELIVAMELRSRLLDLGYSVCGTVASGEEAIELTNKENPGIILMDINIKGEYDGVRAAEIIKADHDIPIIYITAFTDPQTLQRAKITEPYGYIIKPFEERELHTSIEIALYKHNMEKKLKESERRLSITLKSIGDAVISTDKKGLISYINPAAEKLTCSSSEEARGKSILEILNIKEKEAYAAAAAALRELASRGTTRDFPVNLTIHCNGSKEIIIESDVESIIDDKGKVDGMVLSFRDITERKRMEVKLQTALDKAEESSRMKSIFLSNMSHEFRTPMMGILGFAQILKDEIAGSQNKEMADMIINSGNRLLTTLNSILDFSDIESGMVKTIFSEKYIIEIIESIIHQHKAQIRKKGLEFKLDLKDKDLITLADEKLLNQALGCIVDNAVKFTNTGSISFETKKVFVNDKEWAAIGVIDTGIGIDKDKVKIIFDEFRQASEGISRCHEGNGLGLTIAKKIIELMNGFITVESEMDKGSKFTIHLPIVSKEMKQKNIVAKKNNMQAMNYYSP